ncbi:unnamed protein product [Staurois parvus]|uniref:Uncharacterized protein n=1 Tax=Staurois parvus TaxID=386267 RepID=A0ABN9CS71_9NEOB|nr:unnamed protein product [Staurois parvus]
MYVEVLCPINWCHGGRNMPHRWCQWGGGIVPHRLVSVGEE